MQLQLTVSQQLENLVGLISHESGMLLRDLAAQVPQDQAILEIGSFKGKSACYMASTGRTVHCIEPWDTPGNIYGKHAFTDPSVEQTFYAQVKDMKLSDKVVVHKGFSHQVINEWDLPIGMLYIDGSHEYIDVKRDFEMYCRFLTPGAIVVFDDYVGRNRGVTKYVDELRKTSFLRDWQFEVPPAAVARKRLPSTDVKMSVAIMAHPKRERHMPYLLDKLKIGSEKIVWDEKNDRWDTGRRSMLAYDPNATHHVVVQDDALVCRDFVQGAARAISYVPDGHPVSFYTGKVRPSATLVQRMVTRAKAQRSTWISMEGPWWGVAVAVPTNQIEAMVKWADTRTQIQNYDMRMAKYFLAQKVSCYYSLPSLVSHRTGADEPSLVPGRGSSDSRVSYHFIGEDKSALDVQWSLDATLNR